MAVADYAAQGALHCARAPVPGEKGRQEKDLEGIVAVRVLVGIPRLSTPRENRLLALRSWTEIGATIALVVVIVLGNLYAFYKG